MPEHKSTTDNHHTYSYDVDDLARAIELTLRFARQHPDVIASCVSTKDRAEAIARTFDDATDCSDAWDLDDIAHAMKRTIG